MKSKTEEQLTWQKLVRAEPRLRPLLEYAREQERTLVAYREYGEIHFSMYRAYDCYHDVIRPGVGSLIGWDRKRGPKFSHRRGVLPGCQDDLRRVAR